MTEDIAPAGEGLVSEQDAHSSVSSGASIETKRSRFVRILGALSSPLYALGARIDRRRGTMKREGRGRPACAVVSVGGLTVGGAGKTPVAARIARAFSERGFRTVLASRGYRGRPEEAVTIVSDGHNVHAFAERAGDEALVLAAHAPGVPVLVGRDRLRVAHHGVSVFAAEIVVLDDGFQHHALARDFDILCIDARAGLGNGRVLPAGPLRESASALGIADAVIWMDDQGGERMPEAIRCRLREGVPVYAGRRDPAKLHSLGDPTPLDLASLRGKRVGLISGIARPASLRRSAEALGAVVTREIRFRDHHAYCAEDLAPLASPSPTTSLGGSSDEGGMGDAAPVDLWLTTEKDSLKILPKWVGKGVLQVLDIEAEIDELDGLLDQIEAALEEAGWLRRSNALG